VPGILEKAKKLEARYVQEVEEQLVEDFDDSETKTQKHED
jgi:hypothetical protein